MTQSARVRRSTCSGTVSFARAQGGVVVVTQGRMPRVGTRLRFAPSATGAREQRTGIRAGMERTVCWGCALDAPIIQNGNANSNLVVRFATAPERVWKKMDDCGHETGARPRAPTPQKGVHRPLFHYHDEIFLSGNSPNSQNRRLSRVCNSQLALFSVPQAKKIRPEHLLVINKRIFIY